MILMELQGCLRPFQLRFSLFFMMLKSIKICDFARFSSSSPHLHLFFYCQFIRRGKRLWRVEFLFSTQPENEKKKLLNAINDNFFYFDYHLHMYADVRIYSTYNVSNINFYIVIQFIKKGEEKKDFFFFSEGLWKGCKIFHIV